ITSEIVTTGPSNPLGKTVERSAGAWFANYGTRPWTLVAPALGLLGALGSFILLRSGREVPALLASAASIFGIIASVGLSMFPFIVPASVDPRSSLTVWDASSSHLTLFIMLVVAAVFVPVIILYTSWVYRVLWGKVDGEGIDKGSGHAY